MIEKPKKERRFLKTLGKIGEILIQEVLLKVGSNLIKRIGGKKNLPSILFLFLSISLFAQFPNTGNKQRLGFQTTADGLVWRGSISDTASIQPVSNQNAWVILDTVNLKIYSFDFSSNVWNQLPSGTTIDTTSLSNRINLKLNIADTASMLTNYLRSGVAASIYLTQSSAASTYLPLTGGTLSGTLNGINQNLTTNLSITDPIPENPPRIYTSVTTGPSSSASIRLALDQNISGGANMFMGGSQLGGGNGTNPNIFFADTRRAYASVQGIYTGAGITSSGHIVFNTTPNDGTTSLTERMRISQDGSITMGGTLGVTGATTLSGSLGVGVSPTTKLDVLGNSGEIFRLRMNENYTAGAGPKMTFFNSNIQELAFIQGVFNENVQGGRANLYFATRTSDALGTETKMTIFHNGNVGIGATSPNAKLDVRGSVIINEDSGDFDTRIESDGNANMVFVDAGLDRVGIGTNTPSKTLDVNGEVKIATVTATPTALLGKDASNVVGEVTTVAQTGLMTRGETTATTGSPSAIFTVTHGLGSNPSAVIVTSAGIGGGDKIIFEVYTKSSTTFSVQAWNLDGTEASSKSVKIYWLAIK
jgi:hypothetical protein